MRLSDAVTYWGPKDMFGVYGSPIHSLGHIRSDGIVLNISCEVGGYLCKGLHDEADPSKVVGASEILETHPITNLRALQLQTIAVTSAHMAEAEAVS